MLRSAMLRGAGGLGLVLRPVGRRQFVAFREVVPRKTWLFSQNVRCSHREVLDREFLDILTKSKTDGGSDTRVLRYRTMDDVGVLTDEEAQELSEHLKSLQFKDERRRDITFHLLSKLTTREQRWVLQELQEPAGLERELDAADDVDEQEVDDVDLHGVQRERSRALKDVVNRVQERYQWLMERPDYKEDDRLFLFALISWLHTSLIRKVERHGFRKVRAGVKVRLTDWKKFSREMDLEGGRGPVTEFFDEFLQNGEITRDAWETLQRIWTGEEAAPDCTAQRRHGGSKAEVFSDPVFQGAIRDPILQAMRASCKFEREIHDPDDIVDEH